MIRLVRYQASSSVYPIISIVIFRSKPKPTTQLATLIILRFYPETLIRKSLTRSELSQSMCKSKVQPFIAFVFGGRDVVVFFFFAHGVPEGCFVGIALYVVDFGEDVKDDV
jgi:hypothetical protein